MDGVGTVAYLCSSDWRRVDYCVKAGVLEMMEKNLLEDDSYQNVIDE